MLLWGPKQSLREVSRVFNDPLGALNGARVGIIKKASYPAKEASPMAERTEQQSLVRLSDTDFRLEAP